MRRLAMMTLVLTLALPSAAFGGGMTRLRSPDEFIEPGETVEMVAYENISEVQFNEGPWVVYLNLSPMSEPGSESGSPQWHRLGELEITPVAWMSSHRVYVSFDLPVDLESAIYDLSVFNESGDNLEWVGGYLKVGLPVGQEEAHYDWPLDEPLVAKLPFWATLVPTWPGFLVKDLRAGRYPLAAAQYLLDPSILDAPGIVLVAPTTTAVPEPTTTEPATTAPATSVSPPASVTTTAVRVSAPSDQDASLPTFVTMLLMLAAVGGLVWLATSRREMHVVLGGGPIPSPSPTDGSEGLDNHVTTDNQARH